MTRSRDSSPAPGSPRVRRDRHHTLSGLGQTKRPRSRRFVNRQAPWPSCQITFRRLPRRPRKQNRWPPSGSRCNTPVPAMPAPESPSACRYSRSRAIPARRQATGSSWPSISQRRHDCAQRRRANRARDPHPSNLDNTGPRRETLLHNPKLLGSGPAPSPFWTGQNRNSCHVCSFACELMSKSSHAQAQSGKTAPTGGLPHDHG